MSTPAMTAEEAAREMLRVMFPHGSPFAQADLSNKLAEMLTTFAAQVRRDALEEAARRIDEDAIGSMRDAAKAIRALSPSPVKAATVSQWQDISTAPKDEAKSFLVRRRGFVIQASWFEGRLYPDAKEFCIDWENGITDATHWMPFPEPPSLVKAGGETTT